MRHTTVTNFPVGDNINERNNLLGLPAMRELQIDVPADTDIICIYPLEPVDI